MRRLQRSLIVTLAAIAAGAVALLVIERRDRESEPATRALQDAARNDRDILYWYDPMRPEVHFDAAGKSPFMDMDLVPKYADRGAGVIEIDPRMTQSLGMRSVPVRTGTFDAEISTVGTVAVDVRRMTSVETRVAGWVERLAVRAEYDPVKRGQLIAGIYAPELMAAQEDFVLALALADPQIVRAARDRLALFGVGAQQIAALERTREPTRTVDVRAPVDGYVTTLAVREGAQVVPGMPIVEVADLAQVWIMLDVPEAQAGRVRPGNAVEFALPALPGERFTGSIDYVYPELDTRTRTLRARAVIQNPEDRLRPGMYADVTISGDVHDDVLLVPSEAVIRTGTRDVVIVDEGAGRFRPVAVRVGPESAHDTVILAGLEAGQRVVTSGQFLIDSEANVRGVYRRLERGPADMSKPDHGETHTPSSAEPPQ
jgi:Cu(I)/Ag(I) efflux system membrane fusion protein